jgi:hypothetical protein
MRQVTAALVLLMLAPLLYALCVIVAHRMKAAARSENPSGCHTARHRIYRKRRPSALAAPAAAMCEHMDQLGSRA